MFTATKNDEERTAADVKLAANKVKSDVRNGASHLREDLEEAAHRTGRSIRELAHSASDEFAHARDNVADHIRQKPVQSSLIALGAGFILGALFRR